MYKIFFFLLITSSVTCSQEYQNLSQKDIFTKGFPKIITFRGEYIRPLHSDETIWIENLYPSDAVFKKFVNVDELPDIDPNSRSYAVNYLSENPEKLVLNHFLGQAHVNNIAGSSDLYFPGHWLTLPGSQLKASINETQTVISVADISKFSKTIQSNTMVKYPNLMIVSLDANGNRLYDTYEFVTINNISDVNKANNTITVSRGSALSSPKKHPNGAAVIPMSCRLGKIKDFDLNFSLDCPKDKNGKTAADIFLQELTSFHQSDGLLGFTQGIAFDILPWNPRDSDVDTNNDNISDGGIINLENRFALGTFDLIKKIRTMLSDSKLMTSDGYSKRDHRAIDFFDGIESEGLVGVIDAYRGYSKTINVFSYWNKANTSRPFNFSYIVPKFNNALDAADPDQVDEGTELGGVGKINLERLTKATAVALELGYTRPHNADPSDEDLGGDLQKENWLGKPLDTLIRIAKTKEDLLNGKGNNISNWTSNNATFSTNYQSELIVHGTNKNVREDITINFENLNVGNTDDDLVFYLEIQALEGLVDFPNNIPRLVEANTSNLPALETTTRDINLHNDLWGLIDTQQSHLLSFYYRAAGGRNLNFTLTVENNGGFKIKSFTAHSSAQLLARKFENGAVLINPSLKSQIFSLNDLFPGEQYKKLKGFVDTEHNSGDITGNTIVVPATDAYFIYKDKSLNTENFYNDSDLDLVPNPTKGNLSVKGNLQLKDYKIFSALGRCVQEGKLNQQKSINITHFKTGIYFIRFNSNSGFVTKKIIKN